MRYLDGGGLRAVWVVHRRGGKDLTALHQTCRMMHRRRGAYWHVFPTAEQGRKAIWTEFTKEGDRILEQVFPREIRKSPREWSPSAEMVVELKCGSVWRLMGSDNMEVVGAGPVGVVFSEYSLAKPKTWDLVRPMLREREGWAAFIYTPRGNNHGKKLFDSAKKDPAAFCELLTLRDTRAYDPERTIAEERASGMPEALIRQEYLCDWTAANVGSVWGDLLEQLEHEGGVGVAFEHATDGLHTSWDLGIGDATAIWVWVPVDGGVDVVDHYEASGKPLSHYLDWLEQRTAEMGYRYVKHWLPHDARALTLQTGVSTAEQVAKRVGTGAIAITPELSLADGIQAGRWLLQQDIAFHARCADGVESLKAYHYKWDDDKKTFSRKPEHDWSSHTADGFRYLACAVRSADVMRPRKTKPKKPDIRPAHMSFNLTELWEANERGRARR